MSQTIPVCAVCKTPAIQLCAGCKTVYYCSRDHQKKHWKDGHKNNCAFYKIVTLQCGEQYLAAAKDIKQNEIILKEQPIIVAPKSTGNLTCLGCCKTIKNVTENLYRCTICNWPLCGPKCQESLLHKDECNLMASVDYKTDFNVTEKDKLEIYNVIAPLRTLLYKQNNKSKYESLQSILKRAEQSQEYVKQKSGFVFTKITPFLNEKLNLNISEEEILEVCTLFTVNCYEITKENLNVNCLYPTASLLKQDCVSNTKIIYTDDNNQLTLIATIPINKGDLITTSYSEMLWGTLSRRKNIQESKFLACKCERCMDSSELGTYLGAIFCSRCKQTNEEACPKILSTDPLDPQAFWKCEKCEHSIKGRQMIWGNEALKNEMNRLGRNPLHLEQFLVKYKEVLHTSNYHGLVAKYVLSQVYGNEKGYLLADLTDTILERKVDICQELLEITDKLAPGYSTIRGSLLYNLQAAMVVQAKREFNAGKITKAAAQDTLTECMVLLKEATNILSAEPEMKEFLQKKLQELVAELDF